MYLEYFKALNSYLIFKIVANNSKPVDVSNCFRLNMKTEETCDIQSIILFYCTVKIHNVFMFTSSTRTREFFLS